MIDDVFCKIIKKELPAEIIVEGDDWVAINDIYPQAPVHVLIISKRHGSFADYKKGDEEPLGKLLLAAIEVAEKVSQNGFRLIINSGEDSQAEILDHLHIHLLAGKKLGAKIVG